MKSAVSERLADLQGIASRIQALIDAEQPDRPLPCMVLCRVAIAADETANRLAALLSSLEHAREPTKMAPPRRPDTKG